MTVHDTTSPSLTSSQVSSFFKSQRLNQATIDIQLTPFRVRPNNKETLLLHEDIALCSFDSIVIPFTFKVVGLEVSSPLLFNLR